MMSTTFSHWFAHDDERASDIGTLYVLANRDNSLAKVGLTRNGNPDTRADQYARKHGIRWRVYWSALTQRVGEAEARVHTRLADQRFSHAPGAREIFHITPAKAKAVAERCVTTMRADRHWKDNDDPPPITLEWVRGVIDAILTGGRWHLLSRKNKPLSQELPASLLRANGYYQSSEGWKPCGDCLGFLSEDAEVRYFRPAVLRKLLAAQAKIEELSTFWTDQTFPAEMRRLGLVDGHRPNARRNTVHVRIGGRLVRLLAVPHSILSPLKEKD